MQSTISFVLDDNVVTLRFDNNSELKPTTTVLNYLRALPDHKGVKEGCAEGDCGACTVVIAEVVDGKMRYRAVDSCLVFLPMIHGKQLIAVENIKADTGQLHPVQQAMIDTDGSQCGFCTPGFIMSMFALYKNHTNPTRAEIDDALTGNLCRCTGYRPIIEAAAKSCIKNGIDHFTPNEPKIIELLKSVPEESVHIETATQRYFHPLSISEALELKSKYPEADVVNGATDAALRVTKNHELLETVIDLSGVRDFHYINESDTTITIGAGVSLTELMPRIKNNCEALYSILEVFGSLQIRNFATLSGNLATASPIGDSLPVLIAYGASVVLESKRGTRNIPVEKFITGYRETAKDPDELITAVIIPKPAGGEIFRSYKISKRKDLDIATISSGFKLVLSNDEKVESVILAYGGMADKIKRADTVEQNLIAKKWTRETVEDAMQYIDDDFNPISDVRGGAEMRRVAAKNLLMKFWHDTVENQVVV
jgi:xanthine dehydrogenase small subunit